MVATLARIQEGVRRTRNDVRFGSKADMCSALGDVRFTPNSGHLRCKEGCPLCAISRQVQCTHACPLSANSGQSDGSQCAVSVPRYGVFETVVTPKQLAANNKGWRAKDV
jgi:hypothetical protein